MATEEQVKQAEKLWFDHWEFDAEQIAARVGITLNALREIAERLKWPKQTLRNPKRVEEMKKDWDNPAIKIEDIGQKYGFTKNGIRGIAYRHKFGVKAKPPKQPKMTYEQQLARKRDLTNAQNAAKKAKIEYVPPPLDVSVYQGKAVEYRACKTAAAAPDPAPASIPGLCEAIIGRRQPGNAPTYCSALTMPGKKFCPNCETKILRSTVSFPVLRKLSAHRSEPPAGAD